MKALFDAIFAKYAASSLPNLLTKLYNTEAESNAQFPYAVVQIISGVTSDFASGEHFTENYLIQFNLFEKGPNMSALLEAYAILISAFDFATLTIVGYTFLSCVRENTLQTKVEGVWQVNVVYRVKARAS